MMGEEVEGDFTASELQTKATALNAMIGFVDQARGADPKKRTLTRNGWRNRRTVQETKLNTLNTKFRESGYADTQKVRREYQGVIGDMKEYVAKVQK